MASATTPADHDISQHDAVVVGSGPNGLAAAVVLARAGQRVLVVEAGEHVGGGTRTGELTLPGFRHDLCSSIHPFGVASPFLRSLPLAEHGLEWVEPPAAVAHPLDDGSAVLVERSVGATSKQLGTDAGAYRRLLTPHVSRSDALLAGLLAPARLPRHPVTLARFGSQALQSAVGLATRRFTGERARAVFAGCAAHALQPLDRSPTAAFGLVLTMLGHAVGWPFPRGGAGRISAALAAYLLELGGRVETGHRVDHLSELPRCRAILLDLSPREVLRIAGRILPPGYRRALERYRYGPGAYKVDWALDGPVPWTAPEVARAGTVHLGGTLAEVAAGEDAVGRGRNPERPFVLVAQTSLFDPGRAPEGRHTLWGYCHVPNGSTADMTGRIEAQIERFAPGFRDRILARSVRPPAALEAENPNYVGGDINGGVQDLGQLFTRPVARLNPYATPVRGLYLCSSATPPGGGVHGMCGWWAAQAALRHLRRPRGGPPAPRRPAGGRTRGDCAGD